MISREEIPTETTDQAKKKWMSVNESGFVFAVWVRLAVEASLAVSVPDVIFNCLQAGKGPE